MLWSYNPTNVVWAVPVSLAATKGVTDLFSFLPVTKMFQFTGLPLSILCVQMEIIVYNYNWVAPFGNPWVITSYQLTMAYRRLVRPSSAAVT